MTVRTTTKLGLTIEDGEELADQVASLCGNYDILDLKSPSHKALILESILGFGPPGNGYEFDDPGAGVSGWADHSINTGGLWKNATELVAGASLLMTKVKVGDWIELNISGVWNNSPSSAEMCIVTAHSPAPFTYTQINSFGGPCTLNTSTGNGIPSLRGNANVFTQMKAKIMKQVVIGDLVDAATALDPAGTRIWLNTMVKTVGGYKFWFSTPDVPFHLSAINLGQ